MLREELRWLMNSVPIEFSAHLTKDEEQLQFILQVVQAHRRAYPDSLKRTLQN